MTSFEDFPRKTELPVGEWSYFYGEGGPTRARSVGDSLEHMDWEFAAPVAGWMKAQGWTTENVRLEYDDANGAVLYIRSDIDQAVPFMIGVERWAAPRTGQGVYTALEGVMLDPYRIYSVPRDPAPYRLPIPPPESANIWSVGGAVVNTGTSPRSEAEAFVEDLKDKRIPVGFDVTLGQKPFRLTDEMKRLYAEMVNREAGPRVLQEGVEYSYDRRHLRLEPVKEKCGDGVEVFRVVKR